MSLHTLHVVYVFAMFFFVIALRRGIHQQKQPTAGMRCIVRKEMKYFKYTFTGVHLRGGRRAVSPLSLICPLVFILLPLKFF